MRLFASLAWIALLCSAECVAKSSPNIQCLGKVLVDLLTDIRDSFSCTSARRCPANFSDVDGTCLYLDKIRQNSWDDARHVCFTLGGDLAVFPDANAFASALRYINSIVDEDTDEVPYIFVGGLDVAEEGVWRWHTGELMPLGAPFWGSSKTPGLHKQPDGGSLQNCAALNKHDQYYIHDGECDLNASPLCQF
ncbi:C-type lectin domain family 4 member M-like [Penaeus japonicus]|uniref:C-type lectin domain family 4 member M-like n=1 Tax=Penaeus japonicus TaxID=27405 RepID=UPI001C715671|nr:C-type lectin domain family 4 member M-like [Penaeus japonicus]